jgi:hypothetical protein
MIELCLTLCLAFQDPEPTPKDSPSPAAPVFEEWDDKTAKAAVKDFEKKMKPKSASLRDKLAAVEEIARGRNARLVAPLAKTCLSEKALTVRKAAAEALAHQPEKEAKRAVLTLLGDNELRDVPQVGASLILALGTLGYEAGRDWKYLDGLFERDYAAERVPLQQAMLKLIRARANSKRSTCSSTTSVSRSLPIPMIRPTHLPPIGKRAGRHGPCGAKTSRRRSWH